MSQVSAQQVAYEFMALAKRAGDSGFTAWKLQKLLYFAQKWSLSTGSCRPLFYERIKAWKDGPVVPCVYKKYEGAYKVPLTEIPSSGLGEEARLLVHGVWQAYGHMSGEDLSKVSHAHPAYKAAREGLGDSDIGTSPIDEEDMRRDTQDEIRSVDAAVSKLLDD